MESTDARYDADACKAIACTKAFGTRGQRALRARQDIELHIEGPSDDGRPVPEPTSSTAFVAVAV